MIANLPTTVEFVSYALGSFCIGFALAKQLIVFVRGAEMI